MRIGKYIVRGLLGRGGMGRVYKCELPVAGRMVALKLLVPDETLEMLLGKDEVERRFLAEVAMLGSLEHPHIVDVLDVDRDSAGKPYYTMQYFCMNLGILLGEEYESERPTRLLPVERALRYGEQLLDAVARLHHASIVHRDIKPSNVMLTSDDQVKLGDFGLSTHAGQSGEQRQGPSTLKIGTPFYAAPEQEDDPNSAGPASDLYGAGVVLWRMLTGRLPEKDVSFPDHLGDAFSVFLQRAVATDPTERFPDAWAMSRALREAGEAWRAGLEQACRLEPETPVPHPDAPGPAAPGPLRHTPVKVPVAQARERFPVDELWRPLHGLGACGRCFETSTDGITVRDPHAGLTWQRTGSAFPMRRPRAAEFLERLNRARFAGYRDWRLPTLEELLSLVRDPSRTSEYCLEPAFDPAQRWLWSADRKAFSASWYVDAELGFGFWADDTCRFWVRAVRGPDSDQPKESHDL